MIFLRESNQRVQVAGFDRNVLGNRGGAGVARRAQHLIDLRRLLQFPGERVFPAAAADHKNFHFVFDLTVEAAVSAARIFRSAGGTPATTVTAMAIPPE